MNFDVNRQMDPRTGTWSTTIDVPREATAPLLAKVLGITAVGFLVTALGVATSPGWATLPGFVIVLALIFGMNAASKRNAALALGLFYVLTYFMGWEIGPLIHRYILTIGPGIVLQAAATTGLGMACMAIVSYLFSINYRAIAGIGFALLLGVLLLGLVSIFFHFLTPDAYSWMILGVFTLLTVGDFARIRAGGGGATATQLALSIYLDGINIFVAVLQLLSGRRRN
jgi:modulator of FtsH protease